jgi:hypothetical protein
MEFHLKTPRDSAQGCDGSVRTIASSSDRAWIAPLRHEKTTDFSQTTALEQPISHIHSKTKSIKLKRAYISENLVDAVTSLTLLPCRDFLVLFSSPDDGEMMEFSEFWLMT